MVRNGNNVSIGIWYENDFHCLWYEMTIILKIHAGTFVCETIRGFALTTVLTQCFC